VWKGLVERRTPQLEGGPRINKKTQIPQDGNHSGKKKIYGPNQEKVLKQPRGEVREGGGGGTG